MAPVLLYSGMVPTARQQLISSVFRIFVVFEWGERQSRVFRVSERESEKSSLRQPDRDKPQINRNVERNTQ